MDESEFISYIDCQFPYKNETHAHKLILQARSISENASYAVLNEIIRPPFGENISSARKTKLFQIWKKDFQSNILEEINEVAEELILDRLLPVKKTITLMLKIKDKSRCLCALNILYFSCDDKDGDMEIVFKDIVSQWFGKEFLEDCY